MAEDLTAAESDGDDRPNFIGLVVSLRTGGSQIPINCVHGGLDFLS